MTATRAWTAFLVITLVATSACDIVLGINGEYTVAETTSGATTSAGGAASVSASTGSAASSTGSASTSASSSTGMIPCNPDYEGALVGEAPLRCPEGMVLLQDSRRADATPVPAYCIQKREVTFAEYLAIADGGPSCFDAPITPDCEHNEPFSSHEAHFRANARSAVPAHPIDFCDAATYCAARGLRLCAQDELQSACGNEGAVMPGGTGTCVITPDVLALDEEAPHCNGLGSPRDEIFDLVGNVAEHFQHDGIDVRQLVFGADVNVNGLDGEGGAPPTESCFHVGSAPRKDKANFDMSTPTSEYIPVEARVGIRCCADPR